MRQKSSFPLSQFLSSCSSPPPFRFTTTGICICAHVHTCATMCAHLHISVCALVYAHMCSCTCVCLCVCMCICVYVCICLCVCAHIHMRAHPRTAVQPSFPFLLAACPAISEPLPAPGSPCGQHSLHPSIF